MRLYCLGRTACQSVPKRTSIVVHAVACGRDFYPGALGSTMHSAIARGFISCVLCFLNVVNRRPPLRGRPDEGVSAGAKSTTYGRLLRLVAVEVALVIDKGCIDYLCSVALAQANLHCFYLRKVLKANA